MNKNENNNTVGRLVTIGITLVVTALAGLLINYLALPAWNIHSGGFWFFAIVLGIIATVTFMIGAGVRGYYDDTFLRCGWVPGGISILLVVALVVVAIAGSTMVNPDKYANAISVEECDFNVDIPTADSDKIVSVDMKTAQKLGDRKLADFPNAPWYEVDNEYNLVAINGEMYRISSISYGGLFKYNKAKETGIPGYILVNAKTQEAESVFLEEPMKYSPSAMFSYDLSRHLRNNYPSHIFDKSFFEVDDNGTPFWVTGVKESTIGLLGGKVIKSVVITNAVTGECQEYALDKIPEWVDHVQSVDQLMTVIKWHYAYQNGFWNFSKTNVFRTSYYFKDSRDSSEEKDGGEENKFTPFEGYNSIVGNDGKVYFYTGLTPENRSESNIGFLIIDPRTGETKYYDAAGAEESSAQIAAEALVKNMQYSASFPTITNVEGVETYLMTMKDVAGLVQKYALCNVEDYSKCVVGDTIEDAIELYKVKIGLKSEIDTPVEDDKNDKPAETPKETVSVSGVVTAVNEAQVDGYTYYYFMLDDDDSIIYISSIENSSVQPLKLANGVEVTIDFYASTEAGIGIVTEISFK